MSRPDPRQIELLHSEAVFARLPLRTLIEVRGKDRGTFLHNLCTNDIGLLAPGGGCEAFFTTVQGKTLLHALLFCEEESLVIESAPGYAETILPHLDKYLIREDVTLADRTDEWRELWMAGPKVEDQLSKLGLQTSPEMLSHKVGNLRGAAIRVRRVPFAAGSCFLLQVPAADLDATASTLATAEIAEVDGEIVEVARIETGFPSFGLDITADNLPQEINRDQHAISFTKGCYLGQETVARIDALGHVNRYLVRLEFAETTDLPPAGTELVNADKVVGTITSSCWSSPLNSARALGFVKRKAVESTVDLSSEFGPARIVR